MNVAWVIGVRVFCWSAKRLLSDAEYNAVYRLGLHFGMVGE